MPALEDYEIANLLEPYYPAPPDGLLRQLSTYLELLLKWNARTNLTAIREPAEIVTRHFGESLFTVLHLPAAENLLDLGSGAGFPGLPVQLALPSVKVTLAESQNKKSSFLREVVRTLDLPTVVWGARIEDMPAEQVFDVVTLRAVDHPEIALELAGKRLRKGGTIAHLTSAPEGGGRVVPLPGGRRSFLHLIP